MLDPWIIEEIRRREQEERRRREAEERPILEIPRRGPQHPEHDSQPGDENPDGDRGVVIVDFRV